MNYKEIGIIADNSALAQKAYKIFTSKYSLINIEQNPNAKIDLLIVLGGDGFMLHTLHNYLKLNVPFYGVNCGTLGFLLNEYNHDNLLERLNNARKTIIHPLKMIVKNQDNSLDHALAINEVSLFRDSVQAAKIRVDVDNVVRIIELISDGIMVATPAGSSAYNFSAGGRILPLGSKVLALTPISPFRPRRWAGALLPDNSKVEFTILESEKRPVNAVADYIEFKNIKSVEVYEDPLLSIELLFDPSHNLDDRLIKEQFSF